jgi:hypothetical protein
MWHILIRHGICKSVLLPFFRCPEILSLPSMATKVHEQAQDHLKRCHFESNAENHGYLNFSSFSPSTTNESRNLKSINIYREEVYTASILLESMR